jgi:hypothetical protein
MTSKYICTSDLSQFSEARPFVNHCNKTGHDIYTNAYKMACKEIDVQYFSVDNVLIEVGAKFWDNNLQVVQITEVATHSNAYADTGEIQTWHNHTRGSSDTLTGRLRQIGRLVRYFEGKNATDYPNGTSYNDIKETR